MVEKGLRVLKGNEINVVLWRGKYWTNNNRRLHCLKNVYNQETEVRVKFYESVSLIGVEEFRNKLQAKSWPKIIVLLH